MRAGNMIAFNFHESPMLQPRQQSIQRETRDGVSDPRVIELTSQSWTMIQSS